MVLVKATEPHRDDELSPNAARLLPHTESERALSCLFLCFQGSANRKAGSTESLTLERNCLRDSFQL